LTQRRENPSKRGLAVRQWLCYVVDRPMPVPSLVVVPTFNEAETLRPFVRALHDVLADMHVLVVDDASPDGTGAIADEISRNDARVQVLHRASKLGLGSAYVAGFRWGMERGYERFFEMDADLSHDPKFLPAFLAALDAGADVVVGSRNIPGGGVEGWGPARHVLSKGGSLYARLVLGVPVRDLTTGFKAYTRRALGSIAVDALESNGYAFQVETSYRALQRGLRLVEVPIVFVDRRAGQSKMSPHEIFEAALVVWRLRATRGRDWC
jgi:dolichol-phosphate mannosyltransferase